MAPVTMLRKTTRKYLFNSDKAYAFVTDQYNGYLFVDARPADPPFRSSNRNGYHLW